MSRRLAVVCLVSGALWGCSQEEPLDPSSDSRWPDAPALERVGEDVHASVVSPAVPGANTLEVPAWTHEIRDPGADYICPHVQRLDLPEGARLVVRSPDGSRSWTYGGATGEPVPDASPDGFWAVHIPGEAAVLEVFSPVPLPANAVVVDRYARGFPKMPEPDNASLCGQDDSQWARCYEQTEPAVYQRSRAVVRLLINGSGACTGWLVGDEGHVMTNEHCIGSASEAANTNFEILAEGADCATDCASWAACPGTVIATTSSLVKLSATYDYALVKLPVNPSAEYGFLQLRATGAQVGERIYIPQHPGAEGKKIAMQSTNPNDESGFCEVYSTTASPCSGGSGNADVGYFADTRGGSSGSPVIGYGDHLVVALHHCGNCANVGVPIEKIVQHLGTALPNNALGTPGQTPTPTATPTPAPTATPSPSPSPTPDGTPILGNNEIWTVSGQRHDWSTWRVTVPAGQTKLTIRIWGGWGDADLYVRRGAAPTRTAWDYRPFRDGNYETVVVNAPQSGDWYVSLHGWSSYGEVRLQSKREGPTVISLP